jgi:hypothetical protein
VANRFSNSGRGMLALPTRAFPLLSQDKILDNYFATPIIFLQLNTKFLSRVVEGQAL